MTDNNLLHRVWGRFKRVLNKNQVRRQEDYCGAAPLRERNAQVLSHLKPSFGGDDRKTVSMDAPHSIRASTSRSRLVSTSPANTQLLVSQPINIQRKGPRRFWRRFYSESTIIPAEDSSCTSPGSSQEEIQRPSIEQITMTATTTTAAIPQINTPPETSWDVTAVEEKDEEEEEQTALIIRKVSAPTMRDDGLQNWLENPMANLFPTNNYEWAPSDQTMNANRSKYLDRHRSRSSNRGSIVN